jgi:hypothetical protein
MVNQPRKPADFSRYLGSLWSTTTRTCFTVLNAGCAACFPALRAINANNIHIAPMLPKQRTAAAALTIAANMLIQLYVRNTVSWFHR